MGCSVWHEFYDDIFIHSMLMACQLHGNEMLNAYYWHRLRLMWGILSNSPIICIYICNCKYTHIYIYIIWPYMCIIVYIEIKIILLPMTIVSHVFDLGRKIITFAIHWNGRWDVQGEQDDSPRGRWITKTKWRINWLSIPVRGQRWVYRIS